MTNRRSVDWGELGRLSPISDVWGIERVLPVDRHYIAEFLLAHRADVAGRVLEVKDSGYSRAIGGPRVTDAQVIDADPSNPSATMVADLTCADAIASDQFDCFILTQTLHIIYDVRAALRHAIRILRPGGVLLCTIPAVSRVNYEDGGLESGDFWRMTAAAVRRLFCEFVSAEAITVNTHGNVKVCVAFLIGLATEDLAPDELAYNDPWFPLIHCVRVVKPSQSA